MGWFIDCSDRTCGTLSLIGKHDLYTKYMYRCSSKSLYKGNDCKHDTIVNTICQCSDYVIQ